MKSFVALVSCLLVGFTTAKPALLRRAPEIDAQWTVLDLAASAEPHGSVTSFSFNLATNTHNASCTGTGNSYQTLGSLPQTNCTINDLYETGDTTRYSFSWTPSGNGAVLEIWDAVSVLHALRQIPACQLVYENEVPNPNGRIQVYEGPKNFIVQTIMGL